MNTVTKYIIFNTTRGLYWAGTEGTLYLDRWTWRRHCAKEYATKGRATGVMKRLHGEGELEIEEVRPL